MSDKHEELELFSTDADAASGTVSEWGAARAARESTEPGRGVEDQSHGTAGDQTSSQQPPAVPETAPNSADLVVDLRPAPLAETGGHRPPADYGMGLRWGTNWRMAAQGWVAAESGQPIWRPVVTTTDQLASWDIDTYLGVVSAEVAVDADEHDIRRLGGSLARGREVGIGGLVQEAIERGAHAVIGVQMQYTSLGAKLLVTITGTAVTLKEKDAAG